MRIVLHREIPEDPDLHRQWNAVALQMEQPQVFYAYEWALAVQAAYHASLKPLLLLGYEGDDLVGVASLATNPAGENARFLAGSTADYCDFLSPPQESEKFVQAVFEELPEMDTMTLANLPADSQTLTALRGRSRKSEHYIYIRPAYLCSQVELGAGERRQELKTALAEKKKLRRSLRGMGREGPVTFVHLRSCDEIQAALPAFAEAHVARFRGTGRASSLDTPERRLFLAELARRFDGSGVVTLSLLKIGDRPVAWNYGFQFQGSWFWYQPTFDSSQDHNSPGYCLLSQIVIEACDMEGIGVVDLGLGAEGYKERFGNHTRQTMHLTVTKSSLRHLQGIVRYRAARALKQSPKVEAAVRRFLRR